VSHAKLRRRVARAESLAPPQPSTAALARPADEARELAREAAAAFGELIASYREHWKLSAQEAVNRAGASDPATIERVLSCPPDQLEWSDFNALAKADPDVAQGCWEEVKEAARGELRAGHRAARSLESLSASCWGRAQFLAVRAELSEAWRPRDALEQMLIDQLAVYQFQVWQWQNVFCLYSDVANLAKPRQQQGRNPFEPARVTDVEAMEKAAAILERFQALALQMLRALQGLRRPGSVVVRRAGQVNVAHQQVNVAG
jgi:hypothetical protein